MLHESGQPSLELAGDVSEAKAGKKKKRLTPEEDYRQRMIAQYKLNPNIKPEELEKEIATIERQKMIDECKKLDPDCGLTPESDWTAINAFNKKRANRAWAVANNLPPETPREEVDAYILERDRLALAKQLGKPLDTPWHELTLARMREEESRLILEGEKIVAEKPKKKPTR